jgi:Mn2+/Fe2+ NRAMP family transporter
VIVASAVVLAPGVPLIGILVATQALNAVLLLFILPFLIALGRDRATMGPHALGRAGLALTSTAFAFVTVAIVALGAFAVTG